MKLNVDDWSFLNEGGAHIVFYSCSSVYKGMVLRIPKMNKKLSPPLPFPSLTDPITIMNVSLTEVKMFIQHFDHFRCGERSIIPLKFNETIGKISLTIMPNYHYNPDYSHYFSVELKVF